MKEHADIISIFIQARQSGASIELAYKIAIERAGGSEGEELCAAANALLNFINGGRNGKPLC